MLGCLANELANSQPQRTHAVLKLHGTGTGMGAYEVSVRAPLASPSGADALCSRFGGGGRARAAGIDGLPTADLERFLAAFASTRRGGQAPTRSSDGDAGDDDGGGSGQHSHR